MNDQAATGYSSLESRLPAGRCASFQLAPAEMPAHLPPRMAAVQGEPRTDYSFAETT